MSQIQKSSFDAEAIVSGIFNVLRIPGLDADKIISGILAAARIPGLDTSKIISGIFSADRIPGLDAAKIISGVLAAARIPSITEAMLGANSVSTGKLKTASGEISHSVNNYAHYTLPGGAYGFYPQIKMSTTEASTYWGAYLCEHGSSKSGWTSYATNISLRSLDSATIYARQTYVTSSGQDYWLFLIVNKITKDIIGAYAAPDHPAYGNGGDFNKVPHPFGFYNAEKHEIILLEKDTCNALRQEANQAEKSILTLVNESYKPNMGQEENYKPLHSGKFIDKIPELVTSIPNYIKVRKVIKK